MRRGIGQVLRDVLSDEDGVEAYFMTPRCSTNWQGESWSNWKPCGASRSTRREVFAPHRAGGGRHERDCCHRSSSRSFSI